MNSSSTIIEWFLMYLSPSIVIIAKIFYTDRTNKNQYEYITAGYQWCLGHDVA